MRRKRRTGLIVSCSAVARRRFCGVRCRPGSIATRNVSAATSHTADGFAAYFSKKIDDIRCATVDLPMRAWCRAYNVVDIAVFSAMHAHRAPTHRHDLTCQVVLPLIRYQLFWYGSLLTCFYHTSPAWSMRRWPTVACVKVLDAHQYFRCLI